MALINDESYTQFLLSFSLSLTTNIKIRDQSKTPCQLTKVAMQSVMYMYGIKILNVLVEKKYPQIRSRL